MLSGVSLSGDHFFYPNVLESDGSHKRQEWFGCACCPSNITRFIPSVPGYVYAYDSESVYVNLYMSNDASVVRENDTIHISQYTGYPWDGRINITLNPMRETEMAIKLRIPGWARGEAIDGDLYYFDNNDIPEFLLIVNGKKANYRMENGYAVIEGVWTIGDRISLELPMEVYRLHADKQVLADQGMTAFQRGPLVYAAEWADNDEGKALNLFFFRDSVPTSGFEPALMQGAQTISISGIAERSYSEEGFIMQVPTKIKLIPYHLWNNRGPGEMRVWLPHVDN
jgi:DUF1680 family protein